MMYGMPERALRPPRQGRLYGLLLILSILAAAAAAVVAKIAGAPNWVVLLAAATGVLISGVAAAGRAQIEQRAKSRTEIRKRTAGAGEAEALVRDQTVADVRVHRAIRDDVPYIQRDVEPSVVSQLRLERRVLIVGPSMSGKTRLALSAAKAAVGDFAFYVPAEGKSIREELAAGTAFNNVLVWLDDLERYVGGGGLSDADLSSLCASGNVAVGCHDPHR
jgi:eukaryotic-like serine/threonine-protein kinase